MPSCILLKYANTQVYPQCDHWSDTMCVYARMEYEKRDKERRERDRAHDLNGLGKG